MGGNIQARSGGLENHVDAPALFGRTGVISVAVDPVALVITECITVTSAMRKDARWRHSSVAAILGGGSSKPASVPRTAKADKYPDERTRPAEEEDILSSRWGLRGKKGKSMQDNPLMAAFTRLRSDLKGCKGTCAPIEARRHLGLTMCKMYAVWILPLYYTLSSLLYGPHLLRLRSPLLPL